LLRIRRKTLCNRRVEQIGNYGSAPGGSLKIQTPSPKREGVIFIEGLFCGSIDQPFPGDKRRADYLGETHIRLAALIIRRCAVDIPLCANCEANVLPRPNDTG
jgi:hypothetical protein